MPGEYSQSPLVSTGRSTTAEIFLKELKEVADFAFQPIVSIQTGIIHGVEALLRGHQDLGFKYPHEVFDFAWDNDILSTTDLILREIAIEKFASIPVRKDMRLFFNLDGRIFESPDYYPNRTLDVLNRFNVPSSAFCLELSESYDHGSAGYTHEILSRCKAQNYGLAIDDFGQGFSELRMLYEHHPDYVKIDRFFVSGIARDSRKKLFVSTVVNLAHVLGITVVAEGVETEEEFIACKAVGCDLVQGFYVSLPKTDIYELESVYDIVVEANRRDKRNRSTDVLLLRDEMQPIPALSNEDTMEEVFEAFRKNKNQTFFPVVDPAGKPMGLIREVHLKDFIYSQYGRELLINRAYGKRLMEFVTPCPIADINTEAEKILEIYALGENPEGIILQENFHYAGFLSTQSLLRIINEKNIALARDQNPLTRLPGNSSITDFITTALDDAGVSTSFIYFDFDSFKPFNDLYGFRQGDRAIILFADIMRRKLSKPDAFLGHIGGDDFFMGLRGETLESAINIATGITDTFRRDVESFYDPVDRNRGYIEGRGRDGTLQKMPLLTCSAAIVHLPDGGKDCTVDRLMRRIARTKKDAKASPGGIAIASCCGAGDGAE